jgi:hypothetical protein
MSTICTCDNSNKTTGFACNYSPGCPYNKESPIGQACSCGSSKRCTKTNCNYGFTHDRVIDLNKITPSLDPVENRALVNKAMDQQKRISDTTEKIAIEWLTSENKALPLIPKGWLKLLAVDKNTNNEISVECDRRIKLELPNGDIFRLDYDNARKCLTINKDSDTDGAITIQPGGGVNQIYIK